jgi:hypothetical protein
MHYKNPSGMDPPCKRPEGPSNSAAFFIHLLPAGLSVRLQVLHGMRQDSSSALLRASSVYAGHNHCYLNQEVYTRSAANSPIGSRAGEAVRLMLICGELRLG